MGGIANWIGKAALFLLIGVIAVIPKQISAFFSDRTQEINSLIVGGNRIRVVEEFTPPDELIPGSVFTKKVQVENVGHSDCYIRIKAVFTDSRAGQYCSMDWNTRDFSYSAEDGYYYCTKRITPGELTPYLFTRVTVSQDAPAEELGQVSLLVYAESYQAAEFGNWEAAWEDYRRNRP